MQATLVSKLSSDGHFTSVYPIFGNICDADYIARTFGFASTVIAEFPIPSGTVAVIYDGESDSSESNKLPCGEIFGDAIMVFTEDRHDFRNLTDEEWEEVEDRCYELGLIDDDWDD